MEMALGKSTGLSDYFTLTVPGFVRSVLPTAIFLRQRVQYVRRYRHINSYQWILTDRWARVARPTALRKSSNTRKLCARHAAHQPLRLLA